MASVTPTWQHLLYATAGSIAAYAVFVCLLTIPAVQSQVVYLNRVRLTWFQDLNVPEQWGFLRNQVTPFTLTTRDGERLHAWHVLPLGLYQRHERELLSSSSLSCSTTAADVTSKLGFRLLRDDPEALLVLYLHGAAGTVASGFRPESYRAISAASPDKIHVVTIDYRGFGHSTGVPSEAGLLTDAVTLAEWATDVAGVPPSRIVLFAQSLGTAVALSLAHHLASSSRSDRPRVLFAGMVLVAPFVDVELLTATYRVGGIIPILGPLARFSPRLLTFLNTFSTSKWSSKDKLMGLIRLYEKTTFPEEESKDQQRRYHITFLHAMDDAFIPWTHTEQLFWHAANASSSSPTGIGYEELEAEKAATRQDLGDGGWTVTRRTRNGTVREHILKHGLHDKLMSYPAASLAVMRAFQKSE